MENINDDVLKEILSELSLQLQEIYGDTLKSIILYGSVARRTADDESDIDVALIVKDYTEEMHDKMTDLLVDLELGNDVVLSVILIDYDNFVEWGSVLPFYMNVKQEGITLWSAA